MEGQLGLQGIIRIWQTKNPRKNANSLESQNDPISSALTSNNRIANKEILSSVSGVNNYLGRGPAGNRTPETLMLSQSSNHSGPTASSLYHNFLQESKWCT